MKNTRSLMIFAVLASLTFFGCKPIFQKNIQGEWKVDSHISNGNDDTNIYINIYKNYQIEFYDTGDYIEKYFISVFIDLVEVKNTGTWKIFAKPDGKIGEFQLKLTPDNDEPRTYDIKELKKNNFDSSEDVLDLYRYIDSSTNEEIVLERPES